MIVADLSRIAGRTDPAGRRTQNLVGGASPIQAAGFCMGYVTLDPEGGQVPWHDHPQEEVYVILRGTAEACVGEERAVLTAGQALDGSLPRAGVNAPPRPAGARPQRGLPPSTGEDPDR